ncbi:MAG: hypothetical protein IJJ56_04410 [Prevotella sp.]|nr:hypothetical protein [Prevotella sp.]MBR0165373.1 hypothetical protein [Prevotella sp.]
MRKIVGILALAALIVSCGGRRQMSPEEIAHKLDSIKALEIKEKLALQGIDLASSDNPFKVFFDSLNMQTLPVSFTEDYVRFLPGFQEVPQEILSYMEMEGGEHPKAVSLPESIGARLMILAAEESAGFYSLWLYSLDNDYVPIDKLCLYAIEDKEDDIDPEEFIEYFSITSDFEIHLIDYSKTRNEVNSEEVYYIDDSRKFALRNSATEEP